MSISANFNPNLGMRPVNNNDSRGGDTVKGNKPTLYCTDSTSVEGATVTYPKTGSVTTTNAVITKYLQLKDITQLSLLFSTNSTFGSALANVSASINNSTFFVVDQINTGTGAIKGVHYSDASKATTVPINPAIFPYLKIVVPKVTNKITSLIWSAGNLGSIS